MTIKRYVLIFLLALGSFSLILIGCQGGSGSSSDTAEPTKRIAVLIPEELQGGDTTRKEIRDGIALGLKSVLDDKVVKLDFYNPVGLEGTEFTQCTDSDNDVFTTTTDGVDEIYFGKDIYTAITEDGRVRCEKSRKAGLYDQEDVVAVITARTSFSDVVVSDSEKNDLQIVSATGTSTTLENVPANNLIMMSPSNKTQSDTILAETVTKDRKVVMVMDRHQDYWIYSQDLGTDMILKMFDPENNSQMQLISLLPLNYNGTTPTVPISTLKALYDARGSQNLMILYLGGPSGLEATFTAIENESGIDNSNIEWLVADAVFSTDTLNLFNNSGLLKSARLEAFSLGSADQSTEAYQSFQSMYQVEVDAVPTVWSESGYDTGKFLSTVLEEMIASNQAITRASVLQNSGVTEYTGITGKKGASVESAERGTFSYWFAATDSDDTSQLKWVLQ